MVSHGSEAARATVFYVATAVGETVQTEDFKGLTLGTAWETPSTWTRLCGRDQREVRVPGG